MRYSNEKKPYKKYAKKRGTIVRRKRSSYGLVKGVPIGRVIGGTSGFPFPAMLAVKLRTSFCSQVNLDGDSGPIGNNADLYFKLNALKGQGPSVNYPLGTSSAYESNVPSGLIYLLSKDNISGQSIGIYSKYLVKASHISVRWSTRGIANEPTTICILPLPEVAGPNTMLLPQFEEQPLAKTWMFPPVLNECPKVMKRSISVQKLGGLTSLDTTDEVYCGGSTGYGTTIDDPAQLYNWAVRIANSDGTSRTSISGVLYAEIVYDCVFFDRNLIAGGVPS